jgi:hypothetical protein
VKEFPYGRSVLWRPHNQWAPSHWARLTVTARDPSRRTWISPIATGAIRSVERADSGARVDQATTPKRLDNLIGPQSQGLWDRGVYGLKGISTRLSLIVIPTRRSIGAEPPGTIAW